MIEDRTSFSTSKRLKELGFDEPSNLQLWIALHPATTYEVLDGKKEIDYSKIEYYYNDDKHDFHEQQQWNDNRKFVTDYKSNICGELVGTFQAYSSFQLLLALQKELRPFNGAAGNKLPKLLIGEYRFCFDKPWNEGYFEENPTEALGLSLIKILEENNA